MPSDYDKVFFSNNSKKIYKSNIQNVTARLQSLFQSNEYKEKVGFEPPANNDSVQTDLNLTLGVNENPAGEEDEIDEKYKKPKDFDENYNADAEAVGSQGGGIPGMDYLMKMEETHHAVGWEKKDNPLFNLVGKKAEKDPRKKYYYEREFDFDRMRDAFGYVRKFGNFLTKRVPGKGSKYCYINAMVDAVKEQEKKTNGKNAHGNTVGYTVDKLYDDLYYLNDVYELGLNFGKILPESKAQTKRVPGEKSWENYAIAHGGKGIPHSPKEKEEALAKMLVGAYKSNQDPQEPFDLNRARALAKNLMSKPAFKGLASNPEEVRGLLDSVKANPDELDPNKEKLDHAKSMHNEFLMLSRPFYVHNSEEVTYKNVGVGVLTEEKSKVILTRLKAMTGLMLPPDGRSKEYAALYRSLESIDINDPNNSGEKKLQEIFDANCAYMKGRKSLRKSKVEKREFEDSLHVMKELGNCGKHAKYAVSSVENRINEVRLGKKQPAVNLFKYVAEEKRHKGYGFSSMVARAKLDHRVTEETLTDIKNRVVKQENAFKTASGIVPDKKLDRKVFDPLDPPENGDIQKSPNADRVRFKGMPDWSRLADFPKSASEADTVKSSLKTCSNLLDYNKTLRDIDVAMDFATLFGLADTQKYYNAHPTQHQKDNYYNRVVVDQLEIINNTGKYGNDPVLRELAKRYQDPAVRKELFSSPDPQAEGGIRTITNPLDISGVHFNKLKKEYDALKLEMEQKEKNGQQGPEPVL